MMLGETDTMGAGGATQEQAHSRYAASVHLMLDVKDDEKELWTDNKKCGYRPARAGGLRNHVARLSQGTKHFIYIHTETR